ncbi:polyprenol phosphomannose-dependent alpha 1,6 mannosyltransferase MptB [Austwickia chelonae]|uniref:polyprenol phosphomannose-dependent alpha 1,6 mannosyltransferase MptB n=1 Tax=Austwickia chelonae TaxID=100225 RepID=UPI001F0797AC|nr:polyprenol phosphomannose-dependent alpha 1,6 mannosyltransferase MptB [Austwickia chelonae]
MRDVGIRVFQRPRLDLGRLWSKLRRDVTEAWALPLVRRGFLSMLLISAGSLTPAFLPLDQYSSSRSAWIVELLHLQWLQHGPGRFAATMVLSAGVILLLDTWLRLRPVAGSKTAPAITWAIWSIPVLLCPPLFSRDAYSYAAQGLVVMRGIDPYQSGPIAVPGPFGDQVDPMWFGTPAPYGPLALQLQHLIVALVGNNAYAAAVMMRVPALLSMALVAYALPRLAGRVGVNRQQAIWLAVLNPLVMLHIVGGMHNDAMMIALTVLALLLASQGHLVLGCITLAAAAGFKQTALMAIIGVVALAIRYRQGEVKQKPYVIGLFVGSVIWMISFELMTLATGLGWGWIPNLTVPASIRSLLSPPTLVGSIFEGTFYLMGLPKLVQMIPVPLMQSIGMVSFAAVAVWLTWSLAPRRPIMASALALIIFCLCGPVIHPWYMLWGGTLLAATRMNRWTFKAAVYVSLFLCTYSMIDAAFSNDRSALIVSALALVTWSVQGMLRGPKRVASDEPSGLLGPTPWAVAPLNDASAPEPAVEKKDSDEAITSRPSQRHSTSSG